ncbi:helix-turn-helix transcriptional regulator [Mesorhizobium delmotii]|uniref:Phage transcriptional regulator, AlpA n=1 Tax=Mesorhizobium delmotii TaxID=1631247 RepID=A0A2P9APE9_9HYPH|nr:AlpA family phage regulatory protein [Mesorhizobium delmotii]SJM33009.1 Phage transcriptional regulator, AlpA [Mesorhizobium delmotii]
MDSDAVLISIKEAARITSLSRTSINEKRSAGKFPQPVPLGDKRIAFVKSEVDQWIRDRIAARRSEAA